MHVIGGTPFRFGDHRAGMAVRTAGPVAPACTPAGSGPARRGRLPGPALTIGAEETRGRGPRDVDPSAVYQAVIDVAVDATGISPDKISFPHAQQ